MTKKSAVVWHGAKALRQFLVPISDLEPFPGNPRRGDVDSIRASIRRFGQTKPILTSAENANRIVAGHHFRLGAEAEGWTHIAAIPNEFGSEEEARAFLLADNRTHDLGSYRDDLLLDQLDTARKTSGLEGTGYSEAFVADLDRRLSETFAPSSEPPPRLDQRQQATDLGFQVSIYPGADRVDFARHVKLLEREWGAQGGTTEVVLRAVREAALRANQ